MTLTAKQEKFCQSIADGMNQSDAYRAAYSAGGMKDGVIQNKASLIAKKGEVRVRVEQLKSAIAAKELWSRERSVQALAKIADDDEAKANEIVAAIKELNSMHGFNAPTKVDMNLKFPRTINVIAGRA